MTAEDDGPGVEPLVWVGLHVAAFGGEAEDYVSFTRAEWDAMTEAQQEQAVQDLIETHIVNNVDAGGGTVDPARVPRSYLERAEREHAE